MDTCNPIVSIVIPTYNQAIYIAECLQSVLAQTFTQWEVIIVNNYSEDETIEVVQTFNDPRIQLINFRNNGVIAASRNRGIGLAKGEYIAFLDSDDKWSKYKLEDQVRVMQQNKEILLVYSMAKKFGNAHWFSQDFGLVPLPFQAALCWKDLCKGNTIPCSTVLVRKGVLLELGGFDENSELRAVEDFDLWLRVSKIGNISFIPVTHCYYRIHDTAVSRDPSLMELRKIDLYKKHEIIKHTKSSKRYILRIVLQNCIKSVVYYIYTFLEKINRRFFSINFIRKMEGDNK